MSEPRRRPESVGATLAVVAAVTLAVVGALSAVIANRLDTPVVAPVVPECLEGRDPVDVGVGPALRSAWRPLSADDCRPGSWLATYREAGANLARYKGSEPPRVAEDGYVSVYPLGALRADRGGALLGPVGEFAGIFFQLPLDRGEAQWLPPLALHADRGTSGQYDAAAVLDHLAPMRPDGAAATLAWTDGDLFVPGLEYVFGLGHFRDRVGVASAHRLRADIVDPLNGVERSPRDREVLRRALKVAVHEMAHELGIGHCVHYRDCLMGGTGGLREADGKRLALCPLDHAKLQWNVRFDPRVRYAELAAWGDARGLYAEAAYWRRAAEDFPLHAASAGPPEPLRP